MTRVEQRIRKNDDSQSGRKVIIILTGYLNSDLYLQWIIMNRSSWNMLTVCNYNI